MGKPRKIIRFISSLILTKGLVFKGLVLSSTLMLGPTALAHPADPGWTFTGSLNARRNNHTATVLPNGKVLVAGGHSSADITEEGILNSAELYDPATGTWSLTGSLNVPRFYSTATLLPNGKILVAGGISNPSSVTATAELYDPATGTWSLAGDLNSTRFWHSATLLRNGKVLIAGGHGGQDGPRHSAELYDPATGTWSVTGRLLNTGGAGRMMHTATLLQNGKVLVAGGIDGDDFEVSFSSAELYNPDTGTWSVAGSLSTTRALHTATLLQNGRVLVVGGSNAADSAALYDPATDTWSHTGTLSRYGNHTATLLPSGQVLIAGGANFGNGSGLVSVDSADLYDAHTGMWRNTASLHTARYSHTATPLQNGKVLIVGGVNSSVGMLDSAELYDPGTSSNTNPIDDPQFFVRQHYLDFLNREPDPLAAQWVNLINNCPPGDTSCDRIHVSEAFFKSPEFQERGYFLYRFYPVSFGRKPDYAEFMPDLQRVSGFLTPAELEAAKTSLINDFIARNAFRTKYESLSNQTYVEELLATAGVSLSNRQALIDALNNGSQTRAQVLRQVVESDEVYQNFYNQAFVVMQYFGYLRRDPDILYLNWIATLDANPSGSRHMIAGFVNSIEYRARFGP